MSKPVNCRFMEKRISRNCVCISILPLLTERVIQVGQLIIDLFFPAIHVILTLHVFTVMKNIFQYHLLCLHQLYNFLFGNENSRCPGRQNLCFSCLELFVCAKLCQIMLPKQSSVPLFNLIYVYY